MVEVRFVRFSLFTFGYIYMVVFRLLFVIWTIKFWHWFWKVYLSSCVNELKRDGDEDIYMRFLERDDDLKLCSSCVIVEMELEI